MSKSRFLLLKIAIAFLWLTMPFFTAPLVAATVFTFGVVPQQSSQKLAEKWGPVCSFLSEKSGVNLRFTTAPDIPEFERRLIKGRYDFAYMNPYHYTVFCQKPGYLALAKQKDKQISGIIVVRNNSPIQDYRQLAGQTIVFPSPAAFAASILPQALFRNEEIQITPKYVKSHDSVYRNVAQGFFTAGGGVVRTFLNSDPEVRCKLKIIWISELYTPHAIAVHPRVPQQVSQKVLEALLGMDSDPRGIRLLESINFYGFITAADKDWDDVRSLNIDLLNHFIETSP